MSEINVIGVIGALFIAAGFFTHRILVVFNRKNIEIASGVSQGAPMPLEMRWRTLMQMQVLTVGFTAGSDLVIAFCFWAIADKVSDPDVRLLAQICAWMYLSIAAAFLIVGPAIIVSMASLLRKAEAD